jgi:TatD DNase family protein
MNTRYLYPSNAHAPPLTSTTEGHLYCTIGIHPCSSQTFTKHPSGPTFMLSSLRTLAQTHSTDPASPIVAFGEIGLDYDRLMLCPKDIQLQYFAAQLDVAVEVGLPLFLHSRAAHADFTRLLRERLEKLPRRGVVHSFTGEMEEMEELVEMGFDIGVNGCSLKTVENVEVVRRVPWERLQLETDGPWCEMRASHASAEFLKGVEEGWKSVKKEKWMKGAMVKGRNEPCMISRVAIAVAEIRGVSVEEVTERAWENGVRMFGLGER